MHIRYGKNQANSVYPERLNVGQSTHFQEGRLRENSSWCGIFATSPQIESTKPGSIEYCLKQLFFTLLLLYPDVPKEGQIPSNGYRCLCSKFDFPICEKKRFDLMFQCFNVYSIELTIRIYNCSKRRTTTNRKKRWGKGVEKYFPAKGRNLRT